MSQGVRYPVKLDIFKVVPLGDPAYYTLEEAARHYAQDAALTVLSEDEPPRWSLFISQQQHRFTVRYLAASRTPLRVATWERRGDDLLCVRTVDLFYPDGDPVGWVPFADVVTVTRRLYADAVADVELTAPIDVDECHTVTHVPLDDWRLQVPSFGDWAPLISAGEPPQVNRFGLEALDEALALAKRWKSQGVDSTDVDDDSVAGWRTPLTPLNILAAADEIIDGYLTEGTDVISRGAASIIPLFVQASRQGSDRDPREESRRRMDVATTTADALESREGRGIELDLQASERSGEESYAGVLHASGATNAMWWSMGSRHALVLVQSGKEGAGTLTLALHVVPLSWVNGHGAAFAKSGATLMWSLADIGTPTTA